MCFEPYLHFQGDCAAAMAFYADVFGGDLTMMRYAEAPGATPDAAGGDRVMHAALAVGGGSLMGSDYPPGMAGAAQASVSISYGVPDIAAGQAVFERLAEGGEVVMPWGPTFWAQGFGMVKDRFGTHWMVSGPPAEGG
ncbi:VOC family protein [Ruixingdingia sedimenti]|uniref:VOC family protein n=1 Tax=Ruixingdingia sedimenti TaxID=3073604 RepID=A0ABU1F5J9_9RHOB|nr:VOC family protein [Xinfangfangia sp. LG-4]MDR5652155.1 VOC family protein [Xinfangfangia sp. LG-4]